MSTQKQRIKEKILFLKLKITKDPEVFGEIYDLFVEQIYRFIYFKISREEEAQDLTSEVFLKTWQYISQENNEVGNLKALLYRIARNLVVDHYRLKSRKDIQLDEEIAKNIRDEKTGVDEEALVASDMKTIEKALKLVKSEYREVIILRFIEELEIGEIAKILEKSKGAVRVMVHRALKEIRLALQKIEK